jgi:hypothetical protein
MLHNRFTPENRVTRESSSLTNHQSLITIHFYLGERESA